MYLDGDQNVTVTNQAHRSKVWRSGNAVRPLSFSGNKFLGCPHVKIAKSVLTPTVPCSCRPCFSNIGQWNNVVQPLQPVAPSLAHTPGFSTIAPDEIVTFDDWPCGVWMCHVHISHQELSAKRGLMLLSRWWTFSRRLRYHCAQLSAIAVTCPPLEKSPTSVENITQRCTTYGLVDKPTPARYSGFSVPSRCSR